MAANFFLGSCTNEVSPLKIGVDACDNCKMTISDARFGAEIVTRKGRNYKFDDISCLLNFMHGGSLKKTEIEATYLTDYCSPHLLIPVSKCTLSKSEQYGSPMNGNVASFANVDSATFYNGAKEGTILLWNKLE